MATSDKFLTAEELRRLLEKSHYPPDTRDYNHLTEALLLQQENKTHKKPPDHKKLPPSKSQCELC